MSCSVRPVTLSDIPFLWEMLFYAARMSEDGAATAEAAKHDPHLKIYVEDWGRRGDWGVIAYELDNARPLGAAWLRLLTADKSHCGYYDDVTPELAIAVLPEVIGQGVGSALLAALIETVRPQAPAIVLTVRNNNPAIHLYERFDFVVIDAVVNRVGTQSSQMLLKL